MGASLALALGFVLVIEGLMPLLAPRAWREAVRSISGLADGQIRFLGLAAVASGALLVYWLQ